MNTTINKNQTWCSMWGNAVSIAEHRPESYAKDITLRYPVYAPFDGTALRFTFDNYCGSEPVSITKATVSIADCDFNCDDITKKNKSFLSHAGICNNTDYFFRKFFRDDRRTRAHHK